MISRSLAKPLLFIISMALSLLLYLQVSAMEDQQQQQVFRIRPDLVRLDPGLTPLSPPEEVEVLAEGPASHLRALAIDDWKASIDMSKASAGVRSYAVRLNGPPSSEFKVTLKTSKIRIDLAEVKRVDYDVSIIEKGHLSSDLQYGGAEPEPKRVTLVGPAPVLGDVSAVRAFLDLTKLRTGDVPVATVEILGKDDRPLTAVHAEPGTVSIRPKLAAAPATMNVRIEPRWKGVPAFGYALDYELRPNQLTITGQSRVLAAIKKLETEPIDIQEISQDKTLTVPVVFPSGISSTGEKSVVVVIKLTQKQPTAASPTP